MNDIYVLHKFFEHPHNIEIGVLICLYHRGTPDLEK